ncbi:MAG: hypothetical protein VKP70_03575 [Cyanobacteriota bacterium]|nr:hypothetical protein [Cyanobacteriota bacterium]
MKLRYPQRVNEKCLYVYTMPKAGTYLLAGLCEEFGIENSGFHIGFSGYLDTLNHPHKVNRHRPSATRVNQSYIKTFKQSAGRLAFGHLSPSFLPPGVFFGLQVVASYRDPMEVLISEFNDFRFIRRDINFCSTANVVDDLDAFKLYLERQAPVIRDIMIEMSRYIDCFANPLYAAKYNNCVPIVINFNLLSSPEYQSWLDNLFARFLPESKTTFSQALEIAYGKKTKTRSHGYPFDPERMWTPENLDLVKALRLKRLHKNLINLEEILSSSLR